MLLKQLTGFVICNKSIQGLQIQKIPKIVLMIEDEVGMEEMEKMSNSCFLERAKNIIKNDLHNSEPVCSYCLKYFKNRINRNRHVKAIHENENKEFTCEICSKEFMSAVAKNYHENVVHSESKPEIKCRVCDAFFSHSIALTRHMKIHEKEPKEYKCWKCEKVFRRKDTLQKHKRMVHRLFSLKVDMAESFKDQSNQFKCKCCDKIFTGPKGKTDLVTHLNKKSAKV